MFENTRPESVKCCNKSNIDFVEAKVVFLIFLVGIQEHIVCFESCLLERTSREAILKGFTATMQ